MRVILVAVSTAAAFAGTVQAQGDTGSTITIHAALALDGRGGRVRDALITVRDSRSSTSGRQGRRAARDARLGSATIMPGMVERTALHPASSTSTARAPCKLAATQRTQGGALDGGQRPLRQLWEGYHHSKCGRPRRFRPARRDRTPCGSRPAHPHLARTDQQPAPHAGFTARGRARL